MFFLSRIANDISKALSPELPRELGDMDQHLLYILPKIIPYGEDLRELGFWQGKRWVEVRDDEGFHESILHIFNDGGEYLQSLDGNVFRGTWKQLNAYNTLIIEFSGKHELFDLRFLNSDFLVLTKHGNQARKGQRQFFVFAHEYGHNGLDWRNQMERMYNIWRENSLSIVAWLVFIAAIGLIIFLSLN